MHGITPALEDKLHITLHYQWLFIVEKKSLMRTLIRCPVVLDAQLKRNVSCIEAPEAGEPSEVLL